MNFPVPQSKYTDFYDISRFKLTWRINVIMALVLPILAITLYYLGEASAVPSFVGLGCCVGMLLILKFTKSYRLTTIVFSMFKKFV